MTDLTQKQMGLLEQYHRAHAAWLMAVNHEEDAETGNAYAAAFDAYPPPRLNHEPLPPLP